MRAKLFSRTGELAGTDYVIDGDATIGSGSLNAVVLTRPSISPQHARIAPNEEGRGWILEDLNSANGTRVDGVRVTGRVTLGQLHIITFADNHDFVFQVEPAPAARQPVEPVRRAVGDTVIQSAAVMPPPFDAPDPPSRGAQASGDTVLGTLPQLGVPDSLGAGGPEQSTAAHETLYGGPSLAGLPSSLAADGDSTIVGRAHAADAALEWYLEISTDPSATPWTYRLSEGHHVVGRARECDVRLDDPTMSRRHAMITVASGRLTLTDLSSANSTFVQDIPITREVELQSGAIVRFGDRMATLVRK